MFEEKFDSKVSRKSSGFFRFFDFFQSTPFLIILCIMLTVGVGTITMLFNLRVSGGIIDWKLLLRDSILFGIVLLTGTCTCILFRDRTPFFSPRWALLMNGFGAGMFALSYLFGSFLDFFLTEVQSFVETFFMIGALISYIVLFVIYFSFTKVGQPYYIFLALVQPSVGILIYSFFSAQLTVIFLTKAIIFFIISGLIFAVVYAPLMAHVSIPYRKEFPGVGGYKFLRSFVEALLTDKNDESIETFFDEASEEGELKLEYVIIRKKDNNQILGLWVIPNVHFGPFKTCGSAALPEKIYSSFKDIPGLTVFHTTITHANNFSSSQYNSQVISQIQSDLENIEVGNTKATNFIRLIKKKSKLLGFRINNTPFLMLTRHPYPTDDIEQSVGKRIKILAKEYGLDEPLIIDCHNSLQGDEFMVTEDSKEGQEFVKLSESFFKEISPEKEKDDNNSYPLNTYDKIYYGIATDLAEDIPIEWGIGAGGIRVHLIKMGHQETALVHVDANNAYTPVRSGIITLGENEGIDRVELSTSDTHATVRILSAQGYHPLGSKVTNKMLIKRIKPLIKQARNNIKEVNITTHRSISKGYRFWGSLDYFDLIMEVIERALAVSKILLSVGLIIPAIITLILSLFWLG